MESLGATINNPAAPTQTAQTRVPQPASLLDRRRWLLADSSNPSCLLSLFFSFPSFFFNLPLPLFLLHLLPTEISEYEESRRQLLSVQEGSTVLIECPLPHSVPPARPRLKLRGERLEESTGMFGSRFFLDVESSVLLKPTIILFLRLWL